MGQSTKTCKRKKLIYMHHHKKKKKKGNTFPFCSVKGGAEEMI